MLLKMIKLINDNDSNINLETSTMTSLSYGRIFCLESQKIDGTEY